MSYDEDRLRRELEIHGQNMNKDVKIALIGQPGAGKSSLINALTGKDLFETGVRTDVTVKKQEAKLNNLYIVDLPGYGTKRFPLNSWLEEFQPEKLDLYLFVFSGKLHDSDADLFQYFKEWKRERNHPYFIISNKVDQLWDERKTLDELKSEIHNDVCAAMESQDAKVYFTSCKTQEGIDELRKVLLSSEAAIPSILRSRMIAEFKAKSVEDLNLKKRGCLNDLDYYAYSAAANGLNPIPGVDAGVDLAILMKMFADFRARFELDRESLKEYEFLTPIARKIFNYAAKEGIMPLLKSLGKKYATRSVYKYIPLFGQIASAVVGYKMVVAVGESYIDDCYNLAKVVLENSMAKET